MQWVYISIRNGLWKTAMYKIVGSCKSHIILIHSDVKLHFFFNYCLFSCSMEPEIPNWFLPVGIQLCFVY